MNNGTWAVILTLLGAYLFAVLLNSMLRYSKKQGFMLACDLFQEAVKTTSLPAVRIPGQPVLIPEIVVIELVKALRKKYEKDGGPGDPPRMAGA